jgi:thiamine biosynthesis lipoprotein
MAEWAVWSTTVRLIVTEPDLLADARTRVERVISAIDQAASRFRPDSEVHQILRAQGRPVRVSPLLAELVRVAVTAAEQTDGDVDPTIGSWLCELGYDRNLAEIPMRNTQAQVSVHLAPDWRQVRLTSDETSDAMGGELTLPKGMLLDLGATAKAFAADRCAAAVAELGCGALVSIGGDIATAGPAPHSRATPGSASKARDGEQFWRVRVQDGPDEPGTTITLPAGGAIATSSTVHRRWRRGEDVLHHIVDPRTGLPADPVWRTATAVADTCVRANTATTAALIRGRQAPSYLASTGLAARLVAADGSVRTLNGWPAEGRAAEPRRVAA